MLIADMLNSCRNERVAEAAVASIGGDFARDLETMANTCEVAVGTLTVALVRRFALDASERDWRHVSASARGSDFPILAGLRAIIERTVTRPLPASARQRDLTVSMFPRRMGVDPDPVHCGGA